MHSLDVFRAHRVEHIEVKVKKSYMYSLVGMSLFQVAEKMGLVGRELNSFGSNKLRKILLFCRTGNGGFHKMLMTLKST